MLFPSQWRISDKLQSKCLSELPPDTEGFSLKNDFANVANRCGQTLLLKVWIPVWNTILSMWRSMATNLTHLTANSISAPARLYKVWIDFSHPTWVRRVNESQARGRLKLRKTQKSRPAITASKVKRERDAKGIWTEGCKQRWSWWDLVGWSGLDGMSQIKWVLTIDYIGSYTVQSIYNRYNMIQTWWVCCGESQDGTHARNSSWLQLAFMANESEFLKTGFMSDNVKRC